MAKIFFCFYFVFIPESVVMNQDPQVVGSEQKGVRLQDCLIVASSKCGIFGTRDYVNKTLSQCGIVVLLTLSLILNLAESPQL